MHIILIFNVSEAEASDDVGIGESMGVMPDEVLAATFGVAPEVIRAIPDVKKRVVIGKRATPAPG